MTSNSKANLYLGLGCLAFACLAAFLWIPLDTDTGLIEKVRRRVSVGDALAPTVAAGFIGLGGLLLLISDRNATDQPALTLSNLRFVVLFLAYLAATFALMRWAGPGLAALLGTEEGYRVLRDTQPWKWIGFALGGAGLVTGIVAAIERRMTVRALIVGIAAVVALIAIFDLPFDDLLLPPNGDV